MSKRSGYFLTFLFFIYFKTQILSCLTNLELNFNKKELLKELSVICVKTPVLLKYDIITNKSSFVFDTIIIGRGG